MRLIHNNRIIKMLNNSVDQTKQQNVQCVDATNLIFKFLLSKQILQGGVKVAEKKINYLPLECVLLASESLQL